MGNVDNHRRFIELRGQGVSYLKISEAIGVTTRTLMNWSKELANDISNQRIIEFEGLNEEYLLNREQQTKIAGAQLGQITEELLKRDLEDVPTAKLFDMQRKLVKEITVQSENSTFIEETKTDGLHKLDDIYKKVDKWVG
jgi:hypothetical protein